MHTAVIRRIGVDAANRYLVTGSDDKTVRLWDLASGAWLKTFRLPMGPGSEGKIYAVAISPDGQTIAAAGYTGYGWDQSVSIYLFDRTSGRMSHRITGLPNVINHLAYRPDGQRLVATLGGKSGIRVYRTRDYSLVGEDRDYGAGSFGAHFDTQGGLVTTSWDGFLRLYDRGLSLLAKQKAPGGTKPNSVKFSPDGTTIAVSYVDAAVTIHSGDTLAHLYSPDVQGGSGGLGSVAWSRDGRTLYAGGVFHREDGRRLFRIWANGGRGPGRNVPVASEDNIMDLQPLQTGGVAFVTGDPSWGVLTPSEGVTVFHGPDTGSYRGLRFGFRLSVDGRIVQFSYKDFGQAPAQFNIVDRALVLDPLSDATLHSSQETAHGFSLRAGRNTYDPPELNGTPLALHKGETTFAQAIAPDQQTFLLGTDWHLWLFDWIGTAQWNVHSPEMTWAVNIAPNGQVAVAAFGDGTIRWYRLRDGQELLAFFPHADRKRWVLWTPTGYYDASPGAEGLIGWHMNRGKAQAADFFPVSQFRSTYYRPDVIAQVLTTLDEAQAVKIANAAGGGRKAPQVALSQRLPPVVSILSPETGSTLTTRTLTLRYSVRTPSGDPVTEVSVLVDGRLIPTPRDIGVMGTVPREEQEHTLSVTIPDGACLGTRRDIGVSATASMATGTSSLGTCSISLLAKNRNATSTPSTVHVSLQVAASSSDEFVIKPKLYLLSVGVSQYDDTSLQLGFAAKDARDFAAAVEKTGGLYREVVTKVLADEEATKDNILDGLDWIEKETTAKDVAMIFLAGHGVNDHKGIYYYLPVDVNLDHLKRTGVVFSDIKHTVAGLAGKTLLFVDTCHSGDVMGTRRGVADINAVVNELTSAENGAIVFASSTGKQYALEDKKWSNGAFTKALVEGLGGGADYRGTGRITINMLDLYLSERVKELTKGQQTPTTTKPRTIPDFPIALVR